MNKNLFSIKKEHESSIKHVTGKASYTDDIPEPNNLLHGAIGYSKISKGKIKNIDLKDVLNSEGVKKVITYRDIPGINDVGPVFKGDPIFTEDKIEYYGQPIFAVAATTTELARKAIKKAKITYLEKKPILEIKEAIKKKSFVLEPIKIKRGDSTKNIKKSKHTIEGELYSGGQDHFYLEGQITLTIPKEDDNFIIYTSTQHPSETQQIVAKVMNQKFNSINVRVRRIGGGFGGKETQSFIFSAIATLLSKHTGCPTKLRIDRDDDMIITGKRHDFYYKYKVGFNSNGIINGLDIIMASRCGFSPDLSGAINDRAIFHIDNAYYIPNLKLISYRCKTNTVSNTAFRGFGGPQGMFCIENIIENISEYLKTEPTKIRKNNFYKKNYNNITHYGMKIKDNIIENIFDDLLIKSNYYKRKKNIINFNNKNSIFKKGISITPVKFGISFTTTHLNQGGALVHVYTDGSVHLNHGGIEMGQGLMTKISQIAANQFGISTNDIKITSTNTEKVPNTSASAASASTDINGGAVIDAIKKIKKNLEKFIVKKFKYKGNKINYENNKIIFGKNKIEFKKLISLAYMDRVSLSSSGFFKTPKIYFDKKKFKGVPFLYFAYGAAVSEVIIDTLTGENKLVRVDILHDVGNSINPAIDIGQIEGGYVQGLGWLTTEEVLWNNKGHLTTHSPSTYKIPVSKDIPEKFYVNIYKKGKNVENVVNKSKAVGEPPLMLALSAFIALKNATNNSNLISPATPENILMSNIN
tara:strand:- start:2533 stop:4794 length:2262 start_codon:yes stop_codon:yes gene_type:complete